MGDFGPTGGDGGEEDVVLEVLAHSREIHDRGHADLLQEAAGANSGDL